MAKPEPSILDDVDEAAERAAEAEADADVKPGGWSIMLVSVSG